MGTANGIAAILSVCADADTRVQSHSPGRPRPKSICGILGLGADLAFSGRRVVYNSYLKLCSTYETSSVAIDGILVERSSIE